MPADFDRNPSSRFIDSFRSVGGETGRLIAEFDWSKTSIGPIEDWSQSLCTMVGVILRSPIPMVMPWGEDGVMLYNDAYSVFAGGRHPQLLGSKVREGWPEVAAFNDNVMKVGLSGGTLSYTDQELTLYRHGVAEQVWMNLDYSPVPDETGQPAGVLAVVIETTKRIQAERRAKLEQLRQQANLQQMPGFAAILSGTDHVYEYVNDAFVTIAGPRPYIGRTVRENFPELADQGYYELLDQVYKTGVPFKARALPLRLDGEEQLKFIDLLYEPIRDADGKVTGIFIGGYDVTDAKLGEIRANALADFSDSIRAMDTVADISYAAGETLGTTLNVSRVGFGTIDTSNDNLLVERDWNADGVQSIAGRLNLRDFGSFVDDIKAGRFIAIPDARLDDRTAGTAEALEGRHARAFVNYPIVEDEDAVAVLYINSASVRHWSEDELAFIREVGARTRTAVERLRASHALKRVNEELETRIADALAERGILAEIVETTDAFVQVVDLNFNVLAVNRASSEEFERVFGQALKAGDNLLARLEGLPDERAAVQAVWSRAFSGEQFTIVQEFGDPGRDRRYYEIKFNLLHDGDGNRIGAYQFVYDVTQRLTDEARLIEAEEQLRQAQKMEAVGQLTGGIAHDFNNMLAVVSGSLALLLRSTAPGDARSLRLLTAAHEASKRAANLTKRLLAFSRQQPLSPEVIDPNRLVGGMSDLFRHSLGADIQLETVLAGGVWRIHVDQNQLESVLLNLAVNARDAMPDGGKLTIETQNAHLDARYVSREAGVATGQYVLLAVTDTGSGMPQAVIDKAFDPFFTTKEVGKGTGLGLSQVYGFVKQSGGHVKIYSEAGEGTTIKIYLPRHMGEATDTEIEAQPTTATVQAGEVILVVDDEELVRHFSVDALTALGYRVLEASTARAALAIITERADIALLFTDIVMPETNGRQLADIVKTIRPDMPILYTTGYTRNAVVHNGVLDAGVHLISKPFTLDELSKKVTDVLDEAALSKG